MKAAPGSSLWLLGHELRLAWYGAAINAGGKRRLAKSSIAIYLLGWGVLHAFAFALLQALGPGGLRSPGLAALATALLVLLATFMLSNALKASVMALFDRGDLDLLLSSPLPSRSIFTVRLLGVALSIAALYLFLFTPLAHVGIAFGQFHWIGIYVALSATAMLMACAGMLLTLLLVRLFGARRTRVIAQILSAVAGALLFILSQTFSFIGNGSAPGDAGRIAGELAKHPWLAPGSLLWLPGRAALGEALPMLAMVLCAGAVFMLTVARTHRFFVHGLQEAAGSARVAARPAGALRLRFRRSLFDTVVLKEWRLIARDPHLISQVLLQLLYLLPMLFLILRGKGSPAPAIGAGLALLGSSLATSLAWIMISAEDAPDLLRSAPAAQRTIRLAKLAAAVMPPLVLVAPALLWLVVRAPVDGFLISFTSTGAVLSAGVLVLLVGRPTQRSEFRARGKENVLCTVLEAINSVAWGALGWLLVSLIHGNDDVTALLAACALAAAMAVLLAGFLLRRRPA